MLVNVPITCYPQTAKTLGEQIKAQIYNMATVSKQENPMSEHKAALLKVLKRQYARANQEWLSIKLLKIRVV